MNTLNRSLFLACLVAISSNLVAMDSMPSKIETKYEKSTIHNGLDNGTLGICSMTYDSVRGPECVMDLRFIHEDGYKNWLEQRGYKPKFKVVISTPNKPFALSDRNEVEVMAYVCEKGLIFLVLEDRSGKIDDKLRLCWSESQKCLCYCCNESVPVPHLTAGICSFGFVKNRSITPLNIIRNNSAYYAEIMKDCDGNLLDEKTLMQYIEEVKRLFALGKDQLDKNRPKDLVVHEKPWWNFWS